MGMKLQIRSQQNTLKCMKTLRLPVVIINGIRVRQKEEMFQLHLQALKLTVIQRMRIMNIISITN